MAEENKVGDKANEMKAPDPKAPEAFKATTSKYEYKGPPKPKGDGGRGTVNLGGVKFKPWDWDDNRIDAHIKTHPDHARLWKKL